MSDVDLGFVLPDQAEAFRAAESVPVAETSPPSVATELFRASEVFWR
jgi:hypothetical protein